MPAVRAARTGGEHRTVTIVIDLEQGSDLGLRHNRVVPVELGGDPGEELGLLRDHARLRPQTAAVADHLAREMHLQLVEVEHPQMSSESLQTNR